MRTESGIPHAVRTDYDGTSRMDIDISYYEQQGYHPSCRSLPNCQAEEAPAKPKKEPKHPATEGPDEGHLDEPKPELPPDPSILEPGGNKDPSPP